MFAEIVELRKKILDYLCRSLEINDAMNKVLAITGEFFEVDRAYVFENSKDGLMCNNTFEWCKEGIKPEINNLQNVRYLEDLGGRYIENFDEDGIFYCQNIYELPKEQIDILEPQNIKSMLQSAIFVDGIFSGYIGFDNCSKKGWKQQSEAVETLIYISHLITLYLRDYRKKTAELEISENKVKHATNLFEDLLENVNCGVAIVEVKPGKSSEIKYVNSGLCKIIGCDEQTLHKIFYKNHLIAVDEPYKEQLEHVMYEAGRKNSENSVVYHGTMLDGIPKWIIVKVTSLLKENNLRWIYATYYDITTEMQAQVEIRESAENIRSACKFAGLWTLIYDMSNGTTTNCNNTIKDFGVEEHTINFPNTFFEKKIILPESKKIFLNNIDKIKNGIDSVEFDCKIQQKDGKIHWCWVRINRLANMNNLVQISCQKNDYTHDLKTQQYLEKQKHLIGDKTLLRYYVTNLSTNKVLEYQEFENIAPITKVGLTYEQSIEMAVETIIFDSCKVKYLENHNLENILKDFNNGITNRVCEFHRKNSKGEIIWQKNVQNILRDIESGDIFLYEYCYDIHKEKVFEETLQVAIDTNFELFGSIQMTTGQITIVKEKHLAVDREMKIGKYCEFVEEHCKFYIPKENQSEYIKKMSLDTVENVLSKSETYEFTYREVIYGVESVKQIRFSIYDKVNKIVLVTCVDISDTVSRLEEKQHELEEALNAANKATNAKTEFLSRMSHEMRTPMNGIIGMTKLAEDVAIEPNVKKYLNNIDECSQYMLGILNDVLDMNSIEAGKFNYVSKWVNISKLISSSLNMMEPLMTNKDIIYIHPEYDEKSDIEVFVDPLRMKQILVNLINNSYKYTARGGRIEVEISEIEYVNKNVCGKIIVRDNGCGMSQKFLENELFKPFAQEQNQYSDTVRGTGLGLTITKKIVDMLKGTITVNSELNKGTEVSIYLSIPYRERAKEDVKDDIDYVTLMSGKRVLVVDDHELNRKIEQKLLERNRVFVELAENGREALELFVASEENWYDAILMDIRMPDMDGIETTKEIRKLQRGDAKSIPIIAVSANAYSEDVNKSIEAGMNAHLSKPIEPNILYHVLDKYLEN